MIEVNNGSRIDVDLPIFGGLAGFIDRGDGTASMSFRPNRTGNMPIGAAISAGGRTWTLVSNASSSCIRGYRVLELRAAE